MLKNLDQLLAKLSSNSVSILDVDAYPEEGKATAQLLFAEGTRLRIDNWRVIKSGREQVSSLDHGQQYGLPAPINAISELRKECDGKSIVMAHLDKETGDLLLPFSEDTKLQVFGFSGYEVWEITFPDGTGEYSNYAK